MMMSDKRKVAMLIIKGMSDPKKMAMHNDMEQGVKKEHEHEEYHSSMGPEEAMKEFFEAYKENDVKKAVKAMAMFHEMTTGKEYLDDECKGEDSDNPHGY